MHYLEHMIEFCEKKKKILNMAVLVIKLFKKWANIPYLVINYTGQGKTRRLPWKKQKSSQQSCFALGL